VVLPSETISPESEDTGGVCAGGVCAGDVCAGDVCAPFAASRAVKGSAVVGSADTPALKRNAAMVISFFYALHTNPPDTLIPLSVLAIFLIKNADR
jgi:hypothetical protein